MIGVVAANRPLLISVVFAFGLTALAVTGFMRAPDGLTIADFAINAFFGLATPAIAAMFAPFKARNRLIYVFLFCTLLLAGSVYAPRFSPAFLSGIMPGTGAIQIACVLIIWFTLFRSLLGDIAGLSLAAPIAAVLGALGASGFLALEAAQGEGVIGAIASLSLAMSCVVGVGVAADFVQAFARGGSSHDAAGVAAYNATSAAVYASLITVSVFSAGLLPGVESIDWSWRAIIFGAGGVALALTTTLLVTAATLSLSNSSEQTAVVENHRRQDVRRMWRPFRQALPTSSALAFTAILMVLTIAGFFTAYEALTLVKLTLLIACSVFAAITFVSLRTGLYIFVSLLAGMVMIDWLYESYNIASPGLLAELTALAAIAVLYGQMAIAWRDARNPSLKARETAEQAMIEGVHRYLVSAAFIIGAFATADISDLWSYGSETALYALFMIVFGFIVAAPLMTAISAIFGRD